MTKPNILYIHSHDTGRYIQPYGHAIPTPNLQKLAEDGVLFRRCYCANPTCSASRAALLTGQYPHQNGMTGLAHRGFSLNDYSRHILHTLRKAGYYSALAGMQHIITGKRVEQIGYDRVLSTNSHDPNPAAIEFIKQKHARPFFLAVGYSDTHRPFPEPGPEDDPRYTLPPAPLPDTPQTRLDMAGFKASARRLDRSMGEVFQALADNGLADNTLVVCTTDHGIAFPRMKCHLTDSGIGVMLIMRGPGDFSGGKVIDGLVSHVDIYPTLCEVAGIDRPDWLQGVSILPLVNGSRDSVREEVHAEVNYHAAYEPQRAVRTDRYKYIRYYDKRQRPVLPNIDAGPSKSVWMEAGWSRRDPGNEALYDCIFDPYEIRNLADDPEYAEVLDDLSSRLARWMQATNDELLTGRVRAPAGAIANEVDAIDPDTTTAKTCEELGYC